MSFWQLSAAHDQLACEAEKKAVELEALMHTMKSEAEEYTNALEEEGSGLDDIK